MSELGAYANQAIIVKQNFAYWKVKNKINNIQDNTGHLYILLRSISFYL